MGTYAGCDEAVIGRVVACKWELKQKVWDPLNLTPADTGQ